MATEVKYIDHYPDLCRTQVFDTKREAFVYLVEEAATLLEESEPDFLSEPVQKMLRCIDSGSLEGLVKAMNSYLDGSSIYWQCSEVEKKEHNTNHNERLEVARLKIERAKLDWEEYMRRDS